MTRLEAGVEIWGQPRDLETEHQLQEVDRFTGIELNRVHVKALRYKEDHPSAAPDEIVSSLETANKDMRNVGTALGVLNQLDLVGRSGAHVNSVIVLEDTTTVVEDSKTGEGAHHQWYEIDWIQKPDAQSIGKRNKEAVRYVLWHEQEVEREAQRKVGEQRQREADILYEELKPAEIEYALIYKVDSYWLTHLVFERVPDNLTLESCEDLFERALAAKMIQIIRSDDGKVEFGYEGAPEIEQFMNAAHLDAWGNYVNLSLDDGTIKIGGDIVIRHVNPDFVDFLRKKKTELELQPNNPVVKS